MKLWHGSPERIKVDTIQEGRFHGMFFSSDWDRAVGLAVPKYYYTTDVPEEDIADYEDFYYDHDAAKIATEKYEDDADTMLRLISGRSSVWFDSEAARVANRQINGIDEEPDQGDLGELDWDVQRETARMADWLGYKAVAVEDEHGTSYIVLPGANLTEEEEED